MTLTIEINPDLEKQLRDLAAKAGLEPGDYVVNTLREWLSQAHQTQAPHLAEIESELLQQINEGLPQEVWQCYNELVEKRRRETLTPDEHAALIKLSDEIEGANARRFEKLVELAELRRVSLEDLMRELGIKAPAHA